MPHNLFFQVTISPLSVQKRYSPKHIPFTLDLFPSHKMSALRTEIFNFQNLYREIRFLIKRSNISSHPDVNSSHIPSDLTAFSWNTFRVSCQVLERDEQGPRGNNMKSPDVQISSDLLFPGLCVFQKCIIAVENGKN